MAQRLHKKANTKFSEGANHVLSEAGFRTPSQTVFLIGYDFHFGAGDNGNV
jgi:hypothetical protein